MEFSNKYLFDATKNFDTTKNSNTIAVIFDGTFLGFLQVVHDSYYQKFTPQKITTSKNEIGLLDDVVEIFTNEYEVLKVLRAIKEKIGVDALNNLKNSFLHDSKPLWMEMFEYVKLGFKNPKELKNQTIRCVKTIDDAIVSIMRERHKYLGFVRFQKIEDGTYYAQISPKNNILPLLAGHFVKRFKDEKFIIHDIKRNLALIYDLVEVKILQVDSFLNPILHEEEEKFKDLWKRFFDSISIKERLNKKLQQQHVPLRYREFLVEFI